MLHLLMAITTAIPAPANQGFSATDAIIAAQQNNSYAWQENARNSFLKTEVLRALFITDFENAWGAISDDEAFILRETFGAQSTENDAALIWFMRNSSSHSTAIDGGNFSGIYNPFADVWLLIEWQNIGGGRAISNAILVPSSALNSANANFNWLEEDGDYAQNLRRTHLANLNNLGENLRTIGASTLLDGLAKNRANLRAQAFEKLMPWAQALSGFYQNDSNAKIWNNIHKDLVAAQGREADSYGGLPINLRASLEPAAIIKRKDGNSIILVSPLYPSLILSADFAGNDWTKSPKLLPIDLRASQIQGANK